jgi:hypothetical protein
MIIYNGALLQFIPYAALVSAMVLRGIRRSSFQWQWSSHELDGLKYQYAAQYYRGRSEGFVLRFRAPRGLQFLVRPRRDFDRIAKSLHLVAEPQMWDKKFDERLYIECDDENLLSAARERPDLLKLVTALQVRLRADRSELVEIRCEEGNLDLMIACDLEDAGANNAEHDVIAWLRPVVDAICSLKPRDNVKPANRGLQARILFASVFMIGVCGAIVVACFFTRRMEIPFRLFDCSYPYSLAALGAFLVATFLWLGRSPGRHRVLAACLVVGLPGFLTCGTLLTRAMDLDLPQAAPEIIPLKQADLRDGKVSFFDSSDKRTWSDVSPLELSGSAYDRLQSNWGGTEKRPATLLRHPGALGLPWIEVVLPETISN